MKKFLLSSLAIFALIGCGGGGSSTSPDEPQYKTTIKSITITDDNQIERINNSKDATINLSVPDKKDIYVVVTSHFDNQKISIKSDFAVDSKEHNYKITNKSNKSYKHTITPENILKFREDIKEKLKRKTDIKKTVNYKALARVTNEDDTRSFYIDVYDSNYNPTTKKIDATARKVVKNVSTKYGYKTLVVWVEDDEYNDGSITSDGIVTQDMVEKLADTFLKAGSNNDIYDWVTNIYGKEWGDTEYSNLIEDTGYIDILIDDMEQDGIAGYFYSKDNFKASAEPSSNEKVMFYINSRLYVRRGYSEEENEKEILTTLSHEFQHMIHFYQRSVLMDNPHPTWLNELLSETIEDLVATKIDYKGPRNVDPDDGSAGPSGNTGGRYPAFNRCNTVSLTSWYNDCIDDNGNNLPIDYSKVSAFGAFLTRNHGGAKVMHDIEYSSKSGYQAIEEATKTDFKKLLADWATAVTLSDNSDTSVDIPRYNFGDFKNVTYDNITYKLGSINFYNYDPQPTFKENETLDSNASLYYHLGELEGSTSIDINIPEGADITIISK